MRWKRTSPAKRRSQCRAPSKGKTDPQRSERARPTVRWGPLLPAVRSAAGATINSGFHVTVQVKGLVHGPDGRVQQIRAGDH